MKEAEKEVKVLKPETSILLDFVQNGYQRLIKLRNEVWNLEQTEGIGHLSLVERMRQMMRLGASKARLIILILEGKVDVKKEKLAKLIDVSNYCYFVISVVVNEFELLIDHEDEFFKNNLTKVEFVVFKALYRLYAQVYKDSKEVMLKFENAQYDKDLMIPILKIVIEKIQIFERDVEELSKTKGLSERGVKMFERMINDQLKPTEKGVIEQIAKLKSL